ncbi:MFS transporter [Streptomyces subrutilus]|uniref:MFS transporter n=1 Tax=Streptomyces subrutilus TaxID=36818 RepID=UPI001FCBA21B|nr:MFS transporter [Streptomyces subrutilus]
MAAWIALLVLLVAELMNMLDQSVVLTALPAIQESTGAGPAAVQWLTAGYSLPVAVGLITGGRLGDIHGRRRILLIGTVVFTTASLLCGFAAGPGVLIGARVLQGVGVALMIPQVLATLHVTFEGENRSKAFGLYGAVLFARQRPGPGDGRSAHRGGPVRAVLAADLPAQRARRARRSPPGTQVRP